jgi:hypothetical protein
MKHLRFIVPLSALAAYLPLACSDNGPDKVAPGPPTNQTTNAMGGSGGGGGSTATGGSMTGAGTGGSGGSTTGGGASGGSGGTAQNNGMACTKTSECPAAGFACKNNVCSCTTDKPEICGTGTTAACVDKMTDPDYCGDCTTKCDAGATCVAGKCGTKPTMVATATGCGGGAYLATDGKTIYWTEKGGKVGSVPVGGGTVTYIATGQVAPTQIAADSTGVYWLNEGDGKTTGSSTFVKKALDATPASAPKVLVTAKDATGLTGIAVHKGIGYYAEGSNVHQVTLDAQDKVTKDIIVGIAVNYDGGMMTPTGIPIGIAASDTYVMWTTPVRGSVEAHTIAGPVTTPADNKAGYSKLGKSVGALSHTGNVGIDATYGYWMESTKVERSMLTTQEGLYDVVTQSSNSLTAFALGATKVYLVDDQGNMFSHGLAPVAGDDLPTPIARDQMGVSAMAVDATNLYYITGDCVINKLPL